MEFVHEPVLLNEVLEWMDVKENGVYADGTLGGGGHSGAMLRQSGGTAKLYGIDRDLTAIEDYFRCFERHDGHCGGFRTAEGIPWLPGAAW